MCQTPPSTFGFSHCVGSMASPFCFYFAHFSSYFSFFITNLGLVWDSDGDNIIHHLLASVADHQTADHFLAFCFCKPNVHLII